MNQIDFDMAVKVAHIATELDEEKDSICLANELLIEIVSDLHNLAQVLAGDRINEIYDQSDDEEVEA